MVREGGYKKKYTNEKAMIYILVFFISVCKKKKR